MISAQRNYELAMQAIQTYKSLDDRVAQVGLVR
jgi:flagellar basal body rod protein FlgG